jgi:hypothetical protein
MLLLDMFFGIVHVLGKSWCQIWTFEPFGCFFMELAAERISCIEVRTILAISQVTVFLSERNFLHYSCPSRNCLPLEDVLEHPVQV